MTHSRSVNLAYVIVILIWATTPLAIRWGAVDTGFAFAAMARMVLGMLFALLLLALWRLPLPLHRRALLSYLCAGGGLFVSMLCVYWAAPRIDSGLMSVIFGLSPLVTSLLAALWLRERGLGLVSVAGMLLGLAGLALIFADRQMTTADGGLAAIGMLLCAVLSHAASLVGLKWIDDDSSPLATATGALLVAAPMFLLSWWLAGGSLPPALSLRGGLSILYLGLFGSVLGFALYYYIVRHLSSARVSLILVITPVLALLIGRLFNDERHPSQVWLGAAIIRLGLVLHQRGSRLTIRLNVKNPTS
jgi:drug/metabolite transporter (DMT)-like permease